MHTHYFIRFPRFAGGTHLGNLICLDESFATPIPNASKQEYFDFIYQMYSDDLVEAHRKDYNPLGISSNESDFGPEVRYVDRIDYTKPNSINIGHYATFIWRHELLSTFKIKKFILLTFNSPRSQAIIRKREIYSDGTDTLANPYYIEEFRTLYNEWVKAPDGQVDDDINFSIETEELFVPDVTVLIDKINNKFNLNVPASTAQILHSLWYNKNKEFI